MVEEYGWSYLERSYFVGEHTTHKYQTHLQQNLQHWSEEKKEKNTSESALMSQNQKNQQQTRKVMSEAHVVSCCILHIRFTVVEWSGLRKIVNQESSHCAFTFVYQTCQPMATTLSLTIVTLKVSGGSEASFPLLWENLNLFTKPFVFIFLDCFWRFSHFFSLRL